MSELKPVLALVRSVVRGLVTDENGNVVSGAQVRVDGIGKHVTTTNRSSYIAKIFILAKQISSNYS